MSHLVKLSPANLWEADLTPKETVTLGEVVGNWLVACVGCCWILWERYYKKKMSSKNNHLVHKRG